MSGVSRLRESRKDHRLPVMTTGGPRANSVGQPEVDVDVGSGLAPKKAESLKGYVGPTPPPQGRALPVRGEGATRNIIEIGETD